MPVSLTYGTAKLEGGMWVIRAEPHVIVRIKRVFGKVEKTKPGEVRISATLETARDLEWFSQRYPLEIESREWLESQAAEHKRQSERVHAILAGRSNPRPFELALPPREYQKVAAEVALQVQGLLVADEVGLGKTVEGICILTDPATRPALVVTLTHLPRQWEAEIKRFAPSLTTHIVKKGTPYDLTVRQRRRTSTNQLELLPPSFPDVVIINYHKLSGWSDFLAKVPIKTILFDEVQELRHNGTQRYEAAKALADVCEYRVGFSATPIHNLGNEFHSVLDVLRPDSLGTRAEFLREWCVGESGKERIKDPRAFGTYVREQGLMIRRTRVEVGRELPPLTKVPHVIEADPKELDKVSDRTAELARLLLSSNPQVKGDKWRAAEEMSWLVRQATGIAKAPFVAEFVKLLVESKERVLLYGWHHEFYRIVADRLAELNPAVFTGKESVVQKEEAKRRFLAGETPVLMMSLRAGAGLDGLQGSCRTVVFGELDWSPAVHEQAIGRVYRDGQKDPVCAYFLYAESGSDPVVMSALGIKREQLDGVRNPTGNLVEKLQSTEDHVKKLAESILAQRERPSVEAEVAA